MAVKTMPNEFCVLCPYIPVSTCVHINSLLLSDWIIKLGPQSFGDEGLYEYSVVTDPYRVGLFVLTRDVATFRAKYEQDVLSFLEQNGFDSALNKPIETYQGDDCQHAPKPSQP